MVGRAALLAGVLAGPAAAEPCRQALILGLDVSSSVDAEEDALQRGGLAAALLDDAVMAAFLAPGDPVALAVFEWSGRYNQELLLDWVLIRSAADLEAASARIGGSRRSHNDFPTAMGYALGFAASMLELAPDCARATIDLSGDGVNNEGFGPQEAYGAFDFEEVIVNGLVVNGGEFEAETELISYYEGVVIRGPGAFVEVADGFGDFSRAMRRKLIRELGVQMIGGAEAVPEDAG